MKKSIMKTLLFSFAIAMGLLYSVPANAQEGLSSFFGKGDNSNTYVNFDETEIGDGFAQDFGGPDLGIFGRGLDIDFEDLTLQGFGESSGDITFQSFGSNSNDDADVPLGDGFLILMMSCIGYATLKKKTSTNENE